MAIILKEIFPKFSNIHMDVAAGQAGMTAPVTWVHVVESMEIASFLEGGEIAFMTGVALNGVENLLPLIQAIHRKNASGVIVNIGPYIPEIPQEVLDFANSVDFPLMTAPWSVRLTTIMRVLTVEITSLELRDMELETAVKQAMLSPEQEAVYRPQLQNQLVDVDGTFAAMVVRITKDGKLIEKESLSRYKNILKTSLQYQFKSPITLSLFGKLVVVVPNPTREMLDRLVVFCRGVLHNNHGETMVYRIGTTETGISNLHTSYEKASKIAIKSMEVHNSALFYQEMGLYKLLMDVTHRETLESFYGEILKPIDRYDQMQGGDLMEILQLYLNSNGSVKVVADSLFLHRNTINYKLTKISEILQVNLSDLDVRANLTLAMAVRDMLL